RIEYQYRLEGFDRVKATPQVAGDRIVFRIVEGPRIRLGQVHFDGATLFDLEELKQLVPGRFLGEAPPYSLRLVLLIEDGVISAYRDRGYIDIVVSQRVSPEPDKNGRVHVWFAIEEGQPYSVSEIRGVPSLYELQLKLVEGGDAPDLRHAVGLPFLDCEPDVDAAVLVRLRRDPLGDDDVDVTPVPIGRNHAVLDQQHEPERVRRRFAQEAAGNELFELLEIEEGRAVEMDLTETDSRPLDDPEHDAIPGDLRGRFHAVESFEPVLVLDA